MAVVLEDDVILCNCAGCKTMLVSHRHVNDELPKKFKHREQCRHHIKGRPYCRRCLSIPLAGVSGLAGGMSGLGQDCSPSQSNAIRIMEGG